MTSTEPQEVIGPQPGLVRRLLGEPLLQFLLLGGALFLISTGLSHWRASAEHRIVIDAPLVTWQRNLYHAQFGTWPNSEALEALVQSYIRDEALYREAMRLGLGAIVRANDTRAEVADQVKSLGGEFVKVEYEEEGSGGGGYAKVMSEGFQNAQREMYAKQAREVDIIITTALIPGKPAPRLITADMVKSMKAGSVIVDMAAEQGGNCALTEAGKAVVKHGVTIVGYTDLASRLARQSSTLYATNLFRLTEELCKAKDGVIHVDMEDDAIRGLTVIRDGAITWPAPPLKLPAPPAAKPAAAPPAPKGHGHGAGAPMSARALVILFAVAAALFWFLGAHAPAAFLNHFTVFVLACFVGYMVVWNVTPALHTPLMSVTNAISSIIAIGALIQIAPPLAAGVDRPEAWIRALAVIAIGLTAINMFGGFAVTRRMLQMFRK
jgi:NAD(P) transhydrogenase subunit alpha